jgi:hypothetical protein
MDVQWAKCEVKHFDISPEYVKISVTTLKASCAEKHQNRQQTKISSFSRSGDRSAQATTTGWLAPFHYTGQ